MRGIVIKGNSTQISQLFINLIQNAHDACSSRQSSDYLPAITINAAVQDEQVSVTIEDTASAFQTQNIDKIFDPFFTTKDVGKGMGLRSKYLCRDYQVSRRAFECAECSWQRHQGNRDPTVRGKAKKRKETGGNEGAL